MTDEIAERIPYKEEVTGSNPVGLEKADSSK